MRTARDRIRHAISFEIIGLLIITPLGAFVFETPIQHIGIAAFVSATIATLWNYVYNLLYDRVMLRRLGHLRKSLRQRVLHAVLFELGLLLVLMPFLAWYLDISLLQALIMDASFAGFYLVYAFVFNWGYDVIFPVPPRPAPAQTAADAS